MTAANLSADEIRAAIATVPRWFHSIEIAPGIVTPGRATHRVLERLGLPADLTGKSVLDVGCSDGFFSFECERRGASRVVAFDDWSAPYVAGPTGFHTAHRLLRSKVEYHSLDLQTLDPDALGEFDIVLCLGVLYHLRHPFLGMEHLARLTRGALYLETEVTESVINTPSMLFVEGMFRGRDFSTWWVPSIACVQAMARAAGFQRAQTVNIFDTRAVFHCEKDEATLRREVQQLKLGLPPEVAANGAAQSSLERMSTTELWQLREQLMFEHSKLAQRKRVVNVWYGGFRRLLAYPLDVIRSIGLRYR
jgi:tRNA (mo5U34)-methyltransferase